MTQSAPISMQRAPEPGTAAKPKNSITVEDVAGIVNAHILDYRAMVLEGIDSFSPPEEEAASWFMLALGGNLVWASTCLAGPLGPATVAAMSFGGAIVGSGTVALMAKSPPVSDIRPLLKDDILTYTDSLKQELGPTASHLYTSFVKAGADNADDSSQTVKRREMAWAHMFDTSTAPWGESRKIAARTLSDVKLLWSKFRTYFHTRILGIWGNHRFKGTDLADEVQTGYMISLVNSGIANRSPSVKRSMPMELVPGDGEVAYYIRVQGLKYEFPTGGEVFVPAENQLYDKLRSGFAETPSSSEE